MSRSINLIPVATQRRLAVRRLLRVASRSTVTTGACVLVLLGVEWARARAASRALQELEARYAPIVRLVEEHDRLASQIAELEAREELSLRLARDSRGIAVLAALAEATESSDGSVYVRRLSYQGSRPDRSQRSSANRAVRLEGAGADGLAIATFTTRLRDTGVFEAVEVESTNPLVGGSNSGRRFVVNCGF